MIAVPTRRVDEPGAMSGVERVRVALAAGRPVRPARVLAAVRSATRHGRPVLGCAVAHLAWEVADHCWWAELARAGEDAAIAARRADLLVELLARSASAFAAAREWASAERAWQRILVLAEETGDQRRFTSTLSLLGATYQAWGRPHRAVDVQLELAAARERDGDRVGHADALAAAGRTMTVARRPDAAITYLARAEQVLAGLGEADPAMARPHASVLADLARAHAARGAINTARTLLGRALATVVDVDAEAADRIRAHQAALPTRRGTAGGPDPAQRGPMSSTDRSRAETRPS